MAESIVVAVDGSEASLRGLAAALQIAKPVNAKLVLTYVLQPFGVGSELQGMIPPELYDDLQEAGKEIVSRAAEGVKGVEVEQVVLTGSPPESLADFAEKRGAWMVVVGSRGRGAVARMLLGSVANRLIHICARPVLVVR